MAAVQAYFLRYVLFIAPGAVASTAALRAVSLDPTQRRSALIWACAALLHQVSPVHACVRVPCVIVWEEQGEE